MKTKEFIKHVEELGFRVKTHDYIDGRKDFRILRKESYFTAATVSENRKSIFNTDTEYFFELSQEKQDALFNLLVEYAFTPIEEREEEKIYQFKFVNFGDRWNYLTKSRNDGQFYMDNKVQVGAYQTEFIDSEISEFPTWVYDMIEQGHLIKEEKLNE